MAGGRKKIIIDVETVEQLAADGMTKDEIIRYLDVAGGTFYRNQRENAQLAVAYERGKAVGVKEAAELLRTHHIKKKKSLPGLMFYLKTVAKWKDTSEVTLKGDKESPVQVEANVTNSLNIPALSAEALEIISLALQRKAADDAKNSPSTDE